MTKLEQLIQEKCPNGVEYKKLEDCCNILDTLRKPVSKGSRESGEYPYYGANGIQDYINNYIFDGTFVLIGEDGSVINENGTPVINWAEGKIWVNNHAHIISEKGNVMLIRFFYHYIQTVSIKEFVHGNIPKLTQGDLRSVELPVPPLEVQREIVKILDKFMLLTAELTAELTARKEQFETYKTMLFMNSKTNDVKLSELLNSLHTGLNPRKFFKLNTPDAENYYVTIREIKGGYLHFDEKTDRINDEAMNLCNKRSNLEKGDILFSGTGTLGETYVLDETPQNWNIKEGVYALKPKNEKILSKYLKYYLSLNEMKDKYKSLSDGGTVKSISMKKMEELTIKLPSLKEQQRIVDILDRFDALCNDISSGLPAEIEARQKQYEYYRDKLLAFKRI